MNTIPVLTGAWSDMSKDSTCHPGDPLPLGHKPELLAVYSHLVARLALGWLVQTGAPGIGILLGMRWEALVN